MKVWIGIAALLVISLASSAPAPAQMPAGPQNPTIASTLDFQLSIVEMEFVSAAEAMPEDKYSFAPTSGEFKGVRTFAQQVKHVAASNNRFFGAILGQAVSTGPAEGEGSNGPDSIQTKEQIVKYLRDSFALGHKAIATITPENALATVKTPPIPFLKTPLALAGFASVHVMDHYGQVVEYLRMNGLVPPASRPRPAANRPPAP
ncbi:MAG: DinB family protein [Acidobacteriia bacterium]|nr:DinB family protein [Terriglobia bacterium]